MEGALEGDDAEALGLAAVEWKWLRAILIAHSSASAPELQKNTVSAKELRDQPVGELLLGLDAVEVRAVPELLGLPLSAATRCGWAWPSSVTAMPLPKSR